MLAVEGLSVSFPGRRVLQDVNFTLRRGEFCGLIGPNGSGKTTLLRTILGFHNATSGAVRINGVSGRTSLASVAYVPQKNFLDPDIPLRARDLVALGLDGHRLGLSLSNSKRERLVDEMLQAVAAEGFAEQRIGRLSGGQQQRVLIAHALIRRPQLLLLDEPLANLDIRSMAEIVTLLDQLSVEHQVAVLLSAHDMNPLLPFMDRIVYLANGRAASGPTKDVIRTEVLSRLYGYHIDVIHVHGRILVIAADSAEEVPAEMAQDTGSRGADPLSIATFITSAIFEPGFFSNQPVHTAMVIGGCAAIVSGVVGVFTVIRGHSFAGHALADVSSAGGSASFLLGVNPLLGFVVMAVIAACSIEAIGVRRTRERSLATGIVLGAGLGLSALFLYFDVTSHSTTGAAITVMFGSMFAIPPSVVPLALVTGLGSLVITALLYRPLLLSSFDPDLAAVRGINVRLVGLLHLLVLALAVALSAMTIGAILSTALLIGPAAIALRLAKRPGWAILLSSLIGLAATWGGILLAYDSFYWTAHGWPVSFFIVTIIFLAYVLAVHVPDRFGPSSGSLAAAEPDNAMRA